MSRKRSFDPQKSKRSKINKMKKDELQSFLRDLKGQESSKVFMHASAQLSNLR